jgi:DNA-binding GntR family transcriptional regulator
MAVEAGPVFTKNAYAYEELRRRILSGEMTPGQTIAQKQLALELGVSTTPLREALRRLDSEGLVSISAHRDAIVVDLTSEESRSLLEIRERLDPLSARLAADRRTEAEATRILAALERLESFADNSSAEYTLAHRAFHRSIYSASGNEPLTSILEGLWDKTERYRQVRIKTQDFTEERLARIRREHRGIAERILARDPDAAEAAMNAHAWLAPGYTGYGDE